VSHAYNPSYWGGRYGKNGDSRQLRGKKFGNPHLSKQAGVMDNVCYLSVEGSVSR
jgi:hypothetical protein